MDGDQGRWREEGLERKWYLILSLSGENIFKLSLQLGQFLKEGPRLGVKMCIKA